MVGYGNLYWPISNHCMECQCKKLIFIHVLRSGERQLICKTIVRVLCPSNGKLVTITCICRQIIVSQRLVKSRSETKILTLSVR